MLTRPYNISQCIIVFILLLYSCRPEADNHVARRAAENNYYKYIYKYERAADRKRFDIAQLYCDSAMLAMRYVVHDNSMISLYSKALFNKGYTLIEQKKYTAAFEAYNRGRQMIEKTGDSCVYSAYTIMLGSVSGKQGDHLAAARYTKQGVNEQAHCPANYGQFKLIASKLDDIGIFYCRANMPDSALCFFDAALKYLQQNASKYRDTVKSKRFIELYRGVVYGNMGTAYEKKGDTTTAEKLYKESLLINTKKQYDQGDAQYTWLKLAKLYLAGHRFAEAGQQLRLLKYSLDTLPDPEKKINYYRFQLDYLGNTHQDAAAQQLLPAFLKLQDSLNKLRPIPQVDISKEYDHLQDQYDLTLLEKKDQLKTAYLLIAIALGIIIAGIMTFVWVNWRRSSLHVVKLTGLNDTISDKNTQMQQALTALEQSQEETTRVLQIVAHDLRNPIGAMTMLASLMLNSNKHNADDHEMLELIKTSGQNSLDLVNDLLQAHASNTDLKKEPVDLKAMLQYCVELLNYKAEAKGQRLVLNAMPAIVQVNRQKFWRVVSNLVSNAIKFSGPDTLILISLYTRPETIRITVEDHGIGIPAEMADKIFDIFTTAKRPGTAGEQPFGMGLAISKQIVEANGGKIWFESQDGNGTTFYIELPAGYDN